MLLLKHRSCRLLLELLAVLIGLVSLIEAKAKSDEKASYVSGQAIPITDSADTNCTIAAISDEFFHLLEFYVHNDAPLTCRIPTHPLLSSTGASAIAPSTAAAEDYIPLIFALAGTLQSSHLHINTRMNVILHTSPDLAKEEADILAATAYSVPSLSRNSTKIVIGDPLSLQLK
ncbi:MAG: hypothetical protein Q9168_004424, partial [Polycauliona sp. 1 TL-2023]